MSSILIADSHSSSSDDDPETTSLPENALDGPVLFNRRYHRYREGSYAFPNDDEEQSRMDVQFSVIRAAQNGRLFFSPVANPKEVTNVLDVGTGTGIWAIEVADSNIFPDAKITGIDLSPIQPRDVPENVFFEVQDCSDSSWERPHASFDLVYARCLFGSLTDYAQFLITSRKYLKPGKGWMECCELNPQPFCDDSTMTPEWTFAKWESWLDYGTNRAGRPVRVAEKLKQWMIDAGYVDVHEVVGKIPIGSWPAKKTLKAIGREWSHLVAETLAAASYQIFSRELNMTREQIEVFLADTRHSLQNRKVHAYHKIISVYGRRPSAEEERSRGWMAPPPVPKT